jgi:hypothetical protein
LGLGLILRSQKFIPLPYTVILLLLGIIIGFLDMSVQCVLDAGTWEGGLSTESRKWSLLSPCAAWVP